MGDIDGFVEANGKFLFIEGKSWGGLPRGQRIAFERLASSSENTVVVLEGAPPDTVRGWRVMGKKKYTGDYNKFVSFVRSWFEYVESETSL